MTIENLNHKKIAVVGYGTEGQGTVKALAKYAPAADVTILDANANLTLQPANQLIKTRLGPNYLNNLNDFEVVIKTPGIPPCLSLEAAKNKLTNATQIFLDTAAAAGAQVIGITGTKGKSTTASLLYHLLKAAERAVCLVGNIGQPALNYLDQLKPGRLFVYEMSSYQLMDLTTSPPVALITNIFPEHLDYHGNMAAYLAAKKNLTLHQTKDDHVFYVTGDRQARSLARASVGTLHEYNTDLAPVTLGQTNLLGQHNLQNLAGAWAVAKHLGVAESTALTALKTFTGLPHRLQSLGVQHHIHWVDDAISTTPESTIAALKALGDDVKTLILGGQDRGQEFSILAQVIDQSKLENIICLPDTGPQIKPYLKRSDINCFEATNMAQAVTIAKQCHPSRRPACQPEEVRLPQADIVCLLSPAAPSYNQYQNFAQKGNDFKHCIMQK